MYGGFIKQLSTVDEETEHSEDRMNSEPRHGLMSSVKKRKGLPTLQPMRMQELLPDLRCAVKQSHAEHPHSREDNKTIPETVIGVHKGNSKSHNSAGLLASSPAAQSNNQFVPTVTMIEATPSKTLSFISSNKENLQSKSVQKTYNNNSRAITPGQVAQRIPLTPKLIEKETVGTNNNLNLRKTFEPYSGSNASSSSVRSRLFAVDETEGGIVKPKIPLHPVIAAAQNSHHQHEIPQQHSRGVNNPPLPADHLQKDQTYRIHSEVQQSQKFDPMPNRPGQQHWLSANSKLPTNMVSTPIKVCTTGSQELMVHSATPSKVNDLHRTPSTTKFPIASPYKIPQSPVPQIVTTPCSEPAKSPIPTSEEPPSLIESDAINMPPPAEPRNKPPLPNNQRNNNVPSGLNRITVNGRVYIVLSVLGRGGSSFVYQVLEPNTSTLLAVKCVDMVAVDPSTCMGYLNEIQLLSKLQDSDYVIKLYDYEHRKLEKKLFVVMEKGDIDLSALIRGLSKSKKVSAEMILYYWREMLDAVNFIHKRGIIHSDLKPANFLLVTGRLKLIDFGIASSIQADMTSVMKENMAGTYNYISPESLSATNGPNSKYRITYKSDVWSLGCILYSFIYGHTPFQSITNQFQKMSAIVNPSYQIQFPAPAIANCPTALVDAMKLCLIRDPNRRASVEELLKLPYLGQNCAG